MRDAHAFARQTIPELYLWFAGESEVTSPAWGRVCRWVAETPDLVARLDALPGTKRQPNLFLGAIRHLGGPTEPGAALLRWVEERWPGIEHLILSRATQTNEPGRAAVLAPVLASLPQPVSLLEVGPSAGLMLIPDKYRYHYTGDLDADVAPATASRDAPVMHCRVTGTPPGDPAQLVVSSRTGLDLNPLDPGNPDDVRWLRSLVWPGEDAREARLASALSVAARNPARIVSGDVRRDLGALIALAPAGTTPVLMHSATLAYLTREERDDVVGQIRESGVRWLSFEGPTVVTEVRDQLPEPERWDGVPHFVVALDGVPIARAGSHGAWVEWF